MRFLADENCGNTLMSALANAGHDVSAVARTQPGIDDESVFSLAKRENRILLTHDRGFGRIAEQSGERPLGVVLMRLRGLRKEAAAEIVLRAIEEHRDSIAGHFVVIAPIGVRARAYKE